MEKIKIKYAIVAEGKYDANHLRQIFDTLIIGVNGFGIFKDNDTLALLKKLAIKPGLIILTDSDNAGLVIRNHLKKCIKTGTIINIYMPEILGTEKRKTKASAQGFLGVEGIKKDIIIKTFEKYGVLNNIHSDKKSDIKKMDLYNLGLIGAEGSDTLRKSLLKSFDLPSNLNVNSMIEIFNLFTDLEEIKCKMKL